MQNDNATMETKNNSERAMQGSLTCITTSAQANLMKILSHWILSTSSKCKRLFLIMYIVKFYNYNKSSDIPCTNHNYTYICK